MLFSLDTDYIMEGTFTEKISALAKAGFTHVNIRANICEELMIGEWSKVEEVKQILTEHQLAVDWIHTPYECINLFQDNHACRAVSLAALKVCVEIGAILQANSLVVHPINRTFPEWLSVKELQDYQQQLVGSFERLVAYADHRGVRIACENLNDKYGTGVLLYLLEHVPGLGMCFDTGHAQLTASWNIFLPHYIKRIVALHLQDTNGRYDDHLIPGDGMIDFSGFTRVLMDSGYTGVWGCESVSSPAQTDGKTAEELAVKIYRRLMRFVQSAVENRR